MNKEVSALDAQNPNCCSLELSLEYHTLIVVLAHKVHCQVYTQ
jgi:hypothetical protein